MKENMNVDQAYTEQFTKPVRKIGKLSLMLCIVFAFIPAVYVGLRYNAFPSGSQILAGYLLIASTQISWYITEPISYYPVLGEAGSYMSFMSGNVTTIRIASASEAQDVLKCERGSKKAELISTMAIGGSVICSTLCGIIALVAGNLLLSLMPQFVQNMFDFILPGVYGALYAKYLIKDVPTGIFAIVIAIIVRQFNMFSSISFIRMPLIIVLTVILGFVLESRRAAKKRQ